MRSLVALALLVGCGAPQEVTPPSGPGTEYPCGFYEHECQGTKECCPNDEACGGSAFNGCPAHACCAADMEEGSKKKMRSARPLRPD